MRCTFDLLFNYRNNSSIIESALDEPKCDISSVRNMWNMATVLRFIIFTGMRLIVTSRLFDPEVSSQHFNARTCDNIW